MHKEAIEPKDLGFRDPDDICGIEWLKHVEDGSVTLQLVDAVMMNGSHMVVIVPRWRVLLTNTSVAS